MPPVFRFFRKRSIHSGKQLNVVSTRMLSDEDLIPKLDIDAELDLEKINDDLVVTLEKFSPFGPQNKRPDIRQLSRPRLSARRM